MPLKKFEIDENLANAVLRYLASRVDFQETGDSWHKMSTEIESL